MKSIVQAMVSQDLSITIDKKQIVDLPVSSFAGEIDVIDTPDQVADAVAFLMQYPIIGFDTETKPSFRRGNPNKMALMQLSTNDRCFLFRLNIIGMPDELLALIHNPAIVKIGLSIHDDFHVMHRTSDVEPRGFIDLQQFVKDYHITDTSLQKIYAILFGQRISKTQRLTNWEAASLTHPQQVYAATDAWACLRIYNKLMSGEFNPEQRYAEIEKGKEVLNTAPKQS